MMGTYSRRIRKDQIPKKYLKKVGGITHSLGVEAPIEIGQVIAKDLLGENIEFVETKKAINKKFYII